MSRPRLFWGAAPCQSSITRVDDGATRGLNERTTVNVQITGPLDSPRKPPKGYKMVPYGEDPSEEAGDLSWAAMMNQWNTWSPPRFDREKWFCRPGEPVLGAEDRKEAFIRYAAEWTKARKSMRRDAHDWSERTNKTSQPAVKLLERAKALRDRSNNYLKHLKSI